MSKDVLRSRAPGEERNGKRDTEVCQSMKILPWVNCLLAVLGGFVHGFEVGLRGSMKDHDTGHWVLSLILRCIEEDKVGSVIQPLPQSSPRTTRQLRDVAILTQRQNHQYVAP